MIFIAALYEQGELRLVDELRQADWLTFLRFHGVAKMLFHPFEVFPIVRIQAGYPLHLRGRIEDAESAATTGNPLITRMKLDAVIGGQLPYLGFE
jgi:hypothetical protein